MPSTFGLWGDTLAASRWAQGLPYRHQKDLDALVTPLRLAGLPE